MEEYTNRELGILIKEGFKGVHERQDKANHGIIKNRTDIDKNKGNLNKMIGALIVTQVIVVPVIIMAATHLLG